MTLHIVSLAIYDPSQCSRTVGMVRMQSGACNLHGEYPCVASVDHGYLLIHLSQARITMYTCIAVLLSHLLLCRDIPILQGYCYVPPSQKIKWNLSLTMQHSGTTR